VFESGGDEGADREDGRQDLVGNAARAQRQPRGRAASTLHGMPRKKACITAGSLLVEAKQSAVAATALALPWFLIYPDPHSHWLNPFRYPAVMPRLCVRFILQQRFAALSDMLWLRCVSIC
jgi:hypothetical protein